MVIVQAEMAHVDLNLFTLDLCLLSKLLPDLEETFLDFTLNSRLQLFLHVVKL